MKTWQRYVPVMGSFICSIWAAPTVFLASVTNYTGQTVFISKNRHNHAFLGYIPACDRDNNPVTLQLNSHLTPTQEELTIFTQDDYCVSKVHSKPYAHLRTEFNQNTNILSALFCKRNTLKKPLDKKIAIIQCDQATTYCCISLGFAARFNHPQILIQSFTGDISALLKSSLVQQPTPRCPDIALVLKEHKTIAWADVDRYFAQDGTELVR